MPCMFVDVPCKECGHYMCTATFPNKKIGSKSLDGMVCRDDGPDCVIYEEAVKVVGVWLEEMEVAK